MRRWAQGWFGIIIAALLIAFAAPAAAQRIVAVGDLHGDFAAYSAILRAARLIDEVGSSRVDLQACKLEYSIVSPK